VTVPEKLTAFKAYDIRGRVPDELSEELVELTSRAFARLVGPRRVAVGGDMRPTSRSFVEAAARALNSTGVDVVDIGMVGTEQLYFAVFDLELDGGIMVTASHNPGDYNGMKFVREKAIPISSDTGLQEMEALVLAHLRGEENLESSSGEAHAGRTLPRDITGDYVSHLLSYVDPVALAPLVVVANGGNGMAGPVISRLEGHLPLRFVKLFEEPDGSFPHGVPNPLLPERRENTAQAVRESGADLGLAWDGDFDRCFFFDERGGFVDGYYLVGLLARQALRRHPGAKILHDPRLVWNTLEIVAEEGGQAVQSKSGHAFIKERMRQEDAAYGGEMSAHHYFREFSYCDSGMIPWLLVVDLMARSGRKLSDLVEDMIRRYPISGEMNRELADAQGALERFKQAYAPLALAVDETDGVSLEFDNWRCNLRLSNTEPLIRLNLESKGDPALVRQKTGEILAFLDGAGR
jgi:phosphomannomutase/phosphomannomutase/phosphoglucomutase